MDSTASQEKPRIAPEESDRREEGVNVLKTVIMIKHSIEQVPAMIKLRKKELRD